MTAGFKILIPMTTPSLNEWQRCHWKVRQDVKNDFTSAAIASLRSQFKGKEYEATGKRWIVVQRVGKKLLDTDNLYGGVKPLLDALKDLRVILDDNPDCLDLTVTQRQALAREKTFTVVSVEDLE